MFKQLKNTFSVKGKMNGLSSRFLISLEIPVQYHSWEKLLQNVQSLQCDVWYIQAEMQAMP